MSLNLPSTMKAIQWTCPNKNRQDQLKMNESAPVPTASGTQVLIRVHASSVNPIDWTLMKGGVPWHFMPKIKVPGWDAAGTIVALGPKASQSESTPKFEIGDEIMTMLDCKVSGAFQEYTVVDESFLAKKPERWTFEQAAAWPLVVSTVWNALVVRGKLKKGDKVLIVGASGGTGTAAVQLAKGLGAFVVGICSTKNVQMVLDLGADEVVDYKITDVTQKYQSQDFDIVLDTTGTGLEIWAKRSSMLKSTGSFVAIVPPTNAFDTPFHLLATGAGIGSKKVTTLLQSGPGYHFVSSSPDGAVLRQAIEVLDKVAKVDPVIDSVNELTLPSVLTAFDKSESARARGKIVIKIV